MKIAVRLFLYLLFVSLLHSCRPVTTEKPKSPVQLLIFSRTKAFRHECIEPGAKAMQTYLAKYGIRSTWSEDTLMITPEKLKDFDAVMFFQTSGNVLGETQQVAFQKFIQSGGGFIGVHAAADTEYDWPWYGGLAGAYFEDHPDIQPGVLIKTDTIHIATQFLPQRWTRTDEWYNFRKAPENVQVLLQIDEATYLGGKQGDNHPMSWCRLYDGGRSFYTALGHTVESYRDSLFLEHIAQGVIWASAGR